MASKKYLELQEFSDADLQSEVKETAAQLQKLKFDHSIKGLENPLVLRDIRRDLARLNTEIRKREIGSMNADELSKRTKIRQRRK